MPPALRLRNLLLDAPVEAALLAARVIARNRDLLEPQVDPDLLQGRYALVHRYFYWKTQPPIAHRILGKMTLLPFNPLKALGLEDSKGLATEPDRFSLAFQARRLQRHLAQGAPRTSTRAPLQAVSLSDSALLGIFAVHPLDRVGTDLVEVLRRTRGEIIKVKPREPFALTGTGAHRLLTHLGRPIPHLVHFIGGLVQPCITLGLHLQPQCARDRMDVRVVKLRGLHDLA